MFLSLKHSNEVPAAMFQITAIKKAQGQTAWPGSSWPIPDTWTTDFTNKWEPKTCNKWFFPRKARQSGLNSMSWWNRWRWPEEKWPRDKHGLDRASKREIDVKKREENAIDTPGRTWSTPPPPPPSGHHQHHHRRGHLHCARWVYLTCSSNHNPRSVHRYQ